MVIKPVLNMFKEKAREIYGEQLRNIILYGSWARGQATNESDIDLAVVINADIKPGREIDRMIDAVTEINLEYGVLLSIYPVSAKNYEQLKSPLLMNIRREGVVA